MTVTSYPGGISVTDHTRSAGGQTSLASTSALSASRGVLVAQQPIVVDGDHSDAVFFVRSGCLGLDDTAVEASAGDVLVVEANGSARLSARVPTELIRFGSDQAVGWGLYGPPQGTKRTYVLRGIERARFPMRVDDGLTVTTSFWADSTSPGSRMALLEVQGSAAHLAPAHSHSADEIIYVLDGELRIGQAQVGKNMSIFVPANQRYRYRADGPYRFVNFRRDVSSITLKPNGSEMVETVEAFHRMTSAQPTER